MLNPRAVYTDLLNQRRADIAARERRHRSLGYVRLAAVVAAVLLIWQSLGAGRLSVLWTLVPVAIFAALMIVHDRLLRILEERRRAERYFTRALDRLDGKFADAGETGEQYIDPAHLYAADLDVFGKASLFSLLCTARTHIGEDTLAR